MAKNQFNSPLVGKRLLGQSFLRLSKNQVRDAGKAALAFKRRAAAVVKSLGRRRRR